MPAHLHPTRPDEQVDYHAAEALHELHGQERLTIPPELVATDDRREWTLVAVGLIGVVAILAAVLAVVRLRVAGGGDGRRPRREAAPRRCRRRPRGRAAAAPTLTDAKGVAFEKFDQRRSDAPAGAARSGEEVQGRRLRACHPGLEGPGADAGVELRGQRQVPPRHRRVRPDGRHRGRHRRLHAGQRLEQGDEGRRCRTRSTSTPPRSIPASATPTWRPASRCTTASWPSTRACSCTTARRSRCSCTRAPAWSACSSSSRATSRRSTRSCG